MNWIGGLLGLAGIVFVGYRLWAQSAQITQIEADGRFLLMCAAATVAYGSANFLLARSWWLMLRNLDVACPWKWSLRAYGVSQLAKYVPGNVFQFAGRHALGRAAGVSHTVLAKSAVMEILLLALAGCTWAGLTLSLFFPDVPGFVGPALSLTTFTLTLAGLIYWRGRRAAYIFLYQLAFFAVSGLVFILVLNAINPGEVGPNEAPTVGSAFVMSWLLGFLTPGAPAGIGIREFVLTVTLGRMIEESDLLLAVVIGRVVTMLGDLVFYAATSNFRITNDKD